MSNSERARARERIKKHFKIRFNQRVGRDLTPEEMFAACDAVRSGRLKNSGRSNVLGRRSFEFCVNDIEIDLIWDDHYNTFVTVLYPLRGSIPNLLMNAG